MNPGKKIKQDEKLHGGLDRTWKYVVKFIIQCIKPWKIDEYNGKLSANNDAPIQTQLTNRTWPAAARGANGSGAATDGANLGTFARAIVLTVNSLSTVPV